MTCSAGSPSLSFPANSAGPPQEDLDLRNQPLAAGEFSADGGEHAAKRRQVHSSLRLPDYLRLLR
jgi:hypothetical protein